jgi:HK97 family phage prohead protease
MEPKNLEIDNQIKAVDDKEGVVEIVVNAFDNEDSDGDISVRGSFAKTIQENGKRIRHFLNHDWTKLIGVPLELVEKDVGLVARSKLNMNKQLGRDVFEDYRLYHEAGKSLEHSIGVQPVKRDDSDNRYVLEWKLYEYSTLYGWGANSQTPMLSMKNLDKEIVQMMLEKGKYSDERFKFLETINKALKAEPSGDTLSDEPLKHLQKIAKKLHNG